MRGVLLDVGGVFVVPDGDVVGHALAAAGIAFSPHWDEAHFAGVAAVDDLRGEGHDMDRYLIAYGRALDVADPTYAAAVLSPLWRLPSVALWRRVLSESVDGIRKLAQNGLRLGVVSNSDGTVEEQLRLHGICQVGDGPSVSVRVILDSSVVGVAKPDPAIFELGISALELRPDEVAYVGDSVRYDVEPAQAMGLHPFHFDPLGLCLDRAHDHLQQLSGLVERFT